MSLHPIQPVIFLEQDEQNQLCSSAFLDGWRVRYPGIPVMAMGLMCLEARQRQERVGVYVRERLKQIVALSSPHTIQTADAEEELERLSWSCTALASELVDASLMLTTDLTICPTQLNHPGASITRIIFGASIAPSTQSLILCCLLLRLSGEGNDVYDLRPQIKGLYSQIGGVYLIAEEPRLMLSDDEEVILEGPQHHLVH